jgi:predicted nucleotidyltransferase
MHVTGIVAEYNPFHNGHLYQLNESRKLIPSDFVIAVMSGNFTQRGLPSITDKFVRTQMALSCGVDMVLELPVVFATASAERFSEAAISILQKTGLVSSLSFGSEIGDVTLLKDIATVLTDEPPFLSSLIKEYLSQGYSFPRAREAALIHFFSQPTNNPRLHDLSLIQKAVGSPNNILGIEYLKALIKCQSFITPLTIKRRLSNYHDTEIYSAIASATAIRTQFKTSDSSEVIKKCMPPASYELLRKHTQCMPDINDLEAFLHYKFIFSNKHDLYALWDIPDDLIRSLLKCFTKNTSMSQLIEESTSKTYTKATVQRAIFKIILNVLQEDMKRLEPINWIPYIRVLGCKKNASFLLSELTKKASVPVITQLKPSYPQISEEAEILLNYELNASNLYHYIQKNTSPYNQDFTQPFIKY